MNPKIKEIIEEAVSLLASVRPLDDTFDMHARLILQAAIKAHGKAMVTELHDNTNFTFQDDPYLMLRETGKLNAFIQAQALLTQFNDL